MGNKFSQFNCLDGRCTTRHSVFCSGRFGLFWLMTMKQDSQKKKKKNKMYRQSLFRAVHGLSLCPTCNWPLTDCVGNFPTRKRVGFHGSIIYQVSIDFKWSQKLPKTTKKRYIYIYIKWQDLFIFGEILLDPSKIQWDLSRFGGDLVKFGEILA